MSEEEETAVPEDAVAPDEAAAPDEPLSDVRVEIDSVSTTVCQECSCEIDVEGVASFDEVECPDCSARVPVPGKLGPFLLTKMLGAGGMGAVYIGRDEALGRNVAIKVMLKSLGEDKEFIEAFKREAQAAAKINHPNICQIYSFGTEKGQPYIVMELIPGMGFDSFADGEKKVDQGLAMQVGHDIAQGLAAANEENLLHGDIKPENILLDEKLNAKLVDFGIASVAGQASDGIWGTPYYIAPEKILRQKPDGRSDMYSLGATLYHALAGRPPFEGDTPVDVVKARLDHDPKPLGTLRPDLKPEVVQVISRMLQRMPAKRHPTYSSLVSDLAKCVTACGGRKKSLSKLKKTGRIMVGKRGKKSTAPAATSQQKPKTMPKIRVPKKSIVIPSASSNISRATSAPNTAKPSTPKKPASKAPLFIFLIIVAIAVFGGGGFYLYDKHQKELADKRERLAYNNAVTDMSKEMSNVTNAVSSIVKLVNSASEFPAAASNAVKVVLSEAFVHPPSKAAAAPPPVAKPKAAPAPKAKAKPEVVLDEMGREAPAGYTPPEKNEPKPAEPVPEPAAIDVPPPPESEPAIKQLARKLIDDCILLQDKLALADERKAAALTAYEEGRDSKSSFQAAEQCKVIKAIIISMETTHKNTKVVFDRAQNAAKEIEDMRLAFLKNQDDARKAADEAESARAAAEEAARKEAERVALIATEKSLTATAHEQAIDSYKANSFADGLNILTQSAKDLTTDEGKAVMANHIEQGQLLVDMKIFLAKQLTADPYAWGWIVDGRAVDIVKADVNKITTRTREATWGEVTVQQMLHFFKKYMVKQSLPLKTLGRQNLAAAVFCSLHKGGETASASYADTATMHDPALSRLVPKVLPEPEE